MVWSVLLVCLKWMVAHPAEVIMAVGALASMLQGWLDKWPLWSKVARVLSAAGVNLSVLKGELLPKVPVVVKEIEDEVSKKVVK